MVFLWPSMLWLLLSVPLLLLAYLWILRRRKKHALSYASLGIVREAMGPRHGIRRHVPPILMLAAIAVIVFSVARPAALVTLPSEEGTVILAMDISGSMRARDITPNRLAAAQAAAREFIAGQPHSVRIGVVAFAATATLVQQPTTNRDDVLAAIARFRLQRGTAVGNGILASLSAIFEGTGIEIGPVESLGSSSFDSSGANQGAPLSPDTRGSVQKSGKAMPDPVPPGSYRSAVIILLTDGQSNTGPDPLEAANRAADLGVRVYTVGLGTVRGEALGWFGRSMRVQLDELSLKAIAQKTNGRYYKADSAANLNEVYKALSNQLVLEKQKTEITALLTALAGLILLVGIALSLVWFGRVA
ncbi:MAG TPA: VWA domain-containing protein [Spirochaetia bacterium]|nr:VWA domain-containing protein [Spirochaetia bacterium]